MTFLRRCCCYGVILITIYTGVVAYNFDMNNLIVYEDAAKSEGSRESYSGFSIALWNPGNASQEQSWILIGAPRANSTTYLGINEPGTIFKCKIGEPCEEWHMGITNAMLKPGSNSWFGGSMEIQNGRSDSYVVVCAPRWLDRRYKKSKSLPMKGICYKANAKDISKPKTKWVYSSLPEKFDSFGSLLFIIMAESGFSIHAVPEPDHNIILGCPGLNSAHGSPIQYNTRDNTFLVPNVKTDKSAKIYDYSGYAVTSGYYLGSEIGRLYATSAPRSSNLYGQVTIFRFPNSESQSIIAENKLIGIQVGEYFGSALASCDTNGDGRDDLIVGAPQWTKIVDEGRISIFRGNLRGDLTEAQKFEGETTRGRFGSAVTCLGDVDYDGYADVAVGAPYEGNGVVYIYHGSKNGLILTQKLSGSGTTKGFGISISQPKDIDNNNHADMAVGAYLSGHVTLFRSKRTVTTSITLSTDLLDKTLQRNTSSFLIKVCSSYQGKYAPQTLNVIQELRVDETPQRAEITVDEQNLRTHEYPITLRLQKDLCQNFTIRMKSENQNFFDPLKLSMTLRLATNDQRGILLVKKQNISGVQFFNSSAAVVNKHLAITEKYLDIPFALKCKNNVCNSHLSIEMRTNLQSGNSYVIGSDPNVEVNVTVKNIKNEAHNAQAIVTIPFPVQVSHIPSTCMRLQMGKNIQITCKIANPLGTNQTKSVTLSLDMSLVTNIIEKIHLDAITTTRSIDKATGDHKTDLLINCVAQTDIGITRKGTTDQYPYTLASKEEQLPSIAFQQIYEIKNYEATPFDWALLSLSIPMHWVLDGNETEIVRLNKTIGYLDEQEFDCMALETDKNITSLSYDATTRTEWLINARNSTTLAPKSDEKFTIIDEKVFAACPDNRTLHINCTNPSVKWETINCKFGPFRSTQSVAILALKFDLLLGNFTSEIIQDKDIIFFVTNSSVEIIGSPGETVHNEPNLIMIGTMFIASPLQSRVPAWTIAVAVLVGLLLLILIILALFKFGFFKRNKQMELRALLKEKKQVTPGPALESTSGETADAM